MGYYGYFYRTAPIRGPLWVGATESHLILHDDTYRRQVFRCTYSRNDHEIFYKMLTDLTPLNGKPFLAICLHISWKWSGADSSHDAQIKILFCSWCCSKWPDRLKMGLFENKFLMVTYSWMPCSLWRRSNRAFCKSYLQSRVCVHVCLCLCVYACR